MKKKEWKREKGIEIKDEEINERKESGKKMEKKV